MLAPKNGGGELLADERYLAYAPLALERRTMGHHHVLRDCHEIDSQPADRDSGRDTAKGYTANRYVRKSELKEAVGIFILGKYYERWEATHILAELASAVNDWHNE